MDISRLVELPVEILESWDKILESEIAHTRLQIEELEALVKLRNNEIRMSKEYQTLINITLALRKLDAK